MWLLLVAPVALLMADRHACGVLELRLARADKLNALNPPLLDRLHEELDRCEADEGVHTLLLSSEAGRAFCAGGDIREVAALDADAGGRFLAREYALMLRLHALNRRTKVVALADGLILGAGAGLFMAAQARVASDACSLAMPECVLGIMPDCGGLDFLMGLGPPELGRWAALTGASFTAPMMAATGLSTHAFAAGESDALRERLIGCANAAAVDSALSEARDANAAALSIFGLI